MWGIKKWPGRILQGVFASAQVLNVAGIVYPPLIPVAIGIGALQVGLATMQHKSTENGNVITPEVAEDVADRERREGFNYRPK